MNRLIPLTNNQYAMIDEEDFEKVNRISWHVRKGPKPYARGSIWNKKLKKNRLVYMHRYILDVLDTEDEIDHIDGNGLNNQRSNLRFCTKSQNNHNVPKKPNSLSKYKGVTYQKDRKKWAAMITVNYKSIFLGRFRTESDAAHAYNLAAIKYFGKSARLNEIKNE